MLNQKLRGIYERVAAPVGRAVGRTGLSPNAVTVLGLALQVLVAYRIVQGKLVQAGFIAVAAAIADALDGAIAKAQGKASRFGALVDSTADRLADALFFLPIAWLYSVSDVPGRDNDAVAVLAVAGLVASFLVSYVKARAEGLGFSCDVGLAERAERLILMILGLIFNAILVPILVLLSAASLITVVQRLIHVRAQARASGS